MCDQNIDMDNNANGVVLNAKARYTNIFLMTEYLPSPLALNSASPSTEGFVGRCNRCMTPTRLVCARCGDYYCSEKCQRVQWRKHEFYCFRMPPLEKRVEDFKNLGFTPKSDLSIPSLINGLLLLDIDTPTYNMDKQSDIRPLVVQSQQKHYNEDNIASVASAENFVIPAHHSHVILMRFASTQFVVVRIFPDENSLLPFTYEQVLAKVNDCGKVAPCLISKPQINDSVLVVWNGKYYRGAVQYEHSDMAFGILLIDYERFAIFPMGALRVSTDEINQLPRYVVILSLRDVPEKICKREFREFMKKQAKIFKVHYYDAVGVAADVKLISEPTGITLNAVVNDYLTFGLDTIEYAPTEEEIPHKPFEVIQLPEGASNVPAKVLEQQ